jgi:hypothetical protein
MRPPKVLCTERVEGRKTAAKITKDSTNLEKFRPTFSAPPLCSLSFEPKTLSKVIYLISVGVGLGVSVWVGVVVLVGVEVGGGVGVETLSKTTLNS